VPPPPQHPPPTRRFPWLPFSGAGGPAPWARPPQHTFPGPPQMAPPMPGQPMPGHPIPGPPMPGPPMQQVRARFQLKCRSRLTPLQRMPFFSHSAPPQQSLPRPPMPPPFFPGPPQQMGPPPGFAMQPLAGFSPYAGPASAPPGVYGPPPGASPFYSPQLPPGPGPGPPRGYF
jgi:hypothetical protein